MKKVNCALIGSGNIGTDLMYKTLRSDWLNPVWMIGVDAASDGLARARAAGLKTTHEGLEAALPYFATDEIRIAFDATSAYVHAENSRKILAQQVFMIDLTPAAIGSFCVPPVNLEQHMRKQTTNVNMVSCGGQATIPIVNAVSRVQAVSYAEIIATVASKSAGPGTRKNIDEFTRTTALGIERVGGAKKGKAIIILNPAEPPLIMRDTVHCLTEETPDEAAITASIQAMVAEVQRYVPGYRLKQQPVFDGKRISTFLEVAGLGDYLPKYAGNLDIMTAAALCTGELFAQRLRDGTLTFPTLKTEAA